VNMPRTKHHLITKCQLSADQRWCGHTHVNQCSKRPYEQMLFLCVVMGVRKNQY
jgi:hypothetical protein